MKSSKHRDMEGSFENDTQDPQSFAQQNVSENDSPPKQKKRQRTSSKSNQKTKITRRPFKKLSHEVLSSRIVDLQTKVNLLQSRTKQLTERLQAHMHEMECRNQS